MHRVQQHTTRRVLAILASLAILAAVSACGGGLEGPTPVPVGAAPSSAATGDTDRSKAADAALAAYNGYMDAAQKASAIPDPRHPDLRKYLGDPLLARVQAGIDLLRREGAIREGRLITNPTVTVVDLESTPKTVQIQDCVDGTDYKMVYETTRSAVPDKQNVRYVATATVTLFAGEGWLVNQGRSHEDQPC
ncbi:hypothetical protein J2S43_008266 [Catenuloplanes nepalensis]|uniref:Secreted protein/lipoprotein n=1 Tax=Catenuloplanes nepalensis TaxID=587533 RepID=A0ABT9N7S2_9ACTN|nr:hypothetical protein [Catenuloplanes nepalensis]MDP9799754.1 hypothetical protein [Catenuloplanes nepalensis]